MFENQRHGVVRFPVGKATCEHCPHFNRGCVKPSVFVALDKAA
jgi:hypothetical protein